MPKDYSYIHVGSSNTRLCNMVGCFMIKAPWSKLNQTANRRTDGQTDRQINQTDKCRLQNNLLGGGKKILLYIADLIFLTLLRNSKYRLKLNSLMKPYETLTKNSDVYITIYVKPPCRSFGVVLWEMLTGEVPYKDVDSSAIIWGVGNNSLHLPVPESCPDSFKLLLRQCW